MILSNPGSELIDPKILKLVRAISHVERGLTGRQAARIAHVPQKTASRILNDLSTSGLLIENSVGAGIQYTLNKAHLYWTVISSLLEMKQDVRNDLKERVDDLGQKVYSAFIFGSFARGTASSKSDIDLGLLVEDVEAFQLNTVLGIARKGTWLSTGNHLSPFVISLDQFKKMVQIKDPLLDSWDSEAEHLSGEHIQDLISKFRMENG